MCVESSFSGQSAGMYRLVCVLVFCAFAFSEHTDEHVAKVLEHLGFEAADSPEGYAGVGRIKRQAYPVNPPEQTGSSDVYERPKDKSSGGTTAYRVDTNSENAYPINTPYQNSNRNKYEYSRPAAKPAPSKYAVNEPDGTPIQSYSPTQNQPSENAYGVYNEPESAYPVLPAQPSYGEPPRRTETRYPTAPAPSRGAYPIRETTNYARPGSKPAYGTSEPENVYDPPSESAYGKPNRPAQRPPSTGSNIGAQIPQAAKPLSENEDENRMPFLLIKKDNSMYASGALPSLEDPVSDDLCEESVTLVKNQHVCRGQLLFEENFDILNPKIWKNDISIPKKPDYEFTVFVQRKSNSYIEDGNLVLKPTLLSDLNSNVVRYGKLKLDDCALVADSGSCYKEVDKYNILPPVLGARLRTKNTFSFTYGRIDVRAKMPSGDWVYPEIWLEPEESSYGRWYMSGRIVIGLVRGNSILAGPSQESMGVQQLSAGCLYRKNTNLAQNYDKYLTKIKDDGWNQDYHNYSVLWTPDHMQFYVDDELIGHCEPPNSDGRKQVPWKRGTNMAPFDKDFHITLGIAAGGISEYPDSITNGAQSYQKPWKNTGAKATLNFYEDQNNWHSTWSDDTALKIDSVKVYAV